MRLLPRPVVLAVATAVLASTGWSQSRAIAVTRDQITSPTASVRHDTALAFKQSPAPKPLSLSRHMTHGAKWGALAGASLGAAMVLYGCATECHDGGDFKSAAVGFPIFAGAGAIAGALEGFMIGGVVFMIRKL